MGTYSDAEQRLLPGLFASFVPGMLVLADRVFSVTGCGQTPRPPAQICCGAPNATTCWPSSSGSPDGSFLSKLYPTSKDRRHRSAGVVVRVVEYVVGEPSRPPDEETTYRLLTTTLDPTTAPAAELAGAYPERWEF